MDNSYPMKMKLPASALQDDGEDGEMVMPAVGDEVSLPDVMAVVKSVNGDDVEVEIKSVGDHMCAHKEKDGGAEEADPTEETVMAMAKKEDGE